MTLLEHITAGQVVESHPQLGRAVVRIAGETHLPEALVREHLGEAMISVLERLGTEYVRQMSDRLTRIEAVRDQVHAFYDRVLTGQDRNPDVARLGDNFESLRQLLTELSDPAGWAEQRRRTGTPLPQEVIPPAEVVQQRPRPPVRRVQSAAAARRLTELPRAQADAVRAATRAEPDYVQSIVNSETSYGDPRDHTTQLTPWRPEAFDAFCQRNGIAGAARSRLEAGLRELNAARRTELPRDPALASGQPPSAAQALRDRIRTEGAPALGFASDGLVARSMMRAPSMARLAAENPSHFHELALQWLELAERRRLEGRPRPSLRSYVMHLMRTQVRGMLGEFSAVFSLGHDFWVLKGPDFNVTEPGTDFVVVSRRTGELWFCDNKALSAEDLGAVSSLVQNIGQNMADDMASMPTNAAIPMPAGVTAALEHGRLASQEISALVSGRTPEQVRSVEVQQQITRICDRHGIRRVVSNSGGRLSQLRAALTERGIDLAALEGAELQLPDRPLGPPAATGGGR